MIFRSLHKNKWFKLTLLILMAGVIFFFSSQPGRESAQVSGFFSEKILYLLEKVMNFDASSEVVKGFAGVDHFVRKFGHFFEYFLLGLLAANYFLSIDKYLKIDLKVAALRTFFNAFAFCAVYAASDEFHQRFVPNRGPSVGDVLLDSFSAGAAVVIFLLLVRHNAGVKNKNIEDECRGQN